MLYLENETFDNLTVIRRTKNKDTSNSTLWECKCTCGNVTLKSVNFLRRITKVKRSCGCVKPDKSGKNNPKYRHGLATNKVNKLYWIWNSIRQRCLNSKNKRYADYGGRGITISDEWKNSIQTFIADMGSKPSKNQKYTIERRDNNLGYSKQNCYWTTYKEQANNRRNSIRVNYKNKLITLSELSYVTKIPLSTLYARHRKGTNLYAIS